MQIADIRTIPLLLAVEQRNVGDRVAGDRDQIGAGAVAMTPISPDRFRSSALTVVAERTTSKGAVASAAIARLGCNIFRHRDGPWEPPFGPS
jgi:hypothetical protein